MKRKRGPRPYTTLRAQEFKRYRHTPKGRYARHKANAKRRGVPFELTFEEWISIWGDKLGIEGYAMCRPRDEGPYAWWNVYIGTKADNILDMMGWRRNCGPRAPAEPDWDIILGPIEAEIRGSIKRKSVGHVV